jgi:hypothetical protein
MSSHALQSGSSQQLAAQFASSPSASQTHEQTSFICQAAHPNAGYTDTVARSAPGSAHALQLRLHSSVFTRPPEHVPAQLEHLTAQQVSVVHASPSSPFPSVSVLAQPFWSYSFI